MTGRRSAVVALVAWLLNLLRWHRATRPEPLPDASLHGALLRHDVLEALPALRGLPVAVVTGADDRLTRPEHSVRMAQDIGPSAELVVVPGTGHVVNQTRPVEVNAALDRLLERVRLPTASGSRRSA